MKATVCQLRNQSEQLLEEDWQALRAHCQQQASDLVLLPEMPFYRWVAVRAKADKAIWRENVDRHRQWIGRLGELDVALVAGSAPVVREGVAHNEGFVWTAADGYQPIHIKYYVPEEAGFWEARWYRRGPLSFRGKETELAAVGMMICTDMWFLEHARSLARQKIQLLLNPRATEFATRDKWLAGGRVAAICSGAYCLSSNPRTVPGDEADLGGMGWIIDPNGDVLGTTSDAQPFLTRAVELPLADRAKSTYPRYVPE